MLGLSLCGLLASCASGGSVEEIENPVSVGDVAPEITEWTLENDFDSATYDSSKWACADWTNGDMFNCGWVPNHISFENGIMTIKMDNTKSHDKNYSSGEFRSVNKYSYGYYETKMKPCKYTGTNSSFFLYTGPSNGDPWDEIDIEFLGKDTTKVQFNYFVNGQGGHEYMCDLGFDASEDLHTYGIEYGNGYINWYVDGICVYGVTKKGSQSFPSHKMQVMTNFWPGTGVDAWLGAFNYTTPLYDEYDYIKFKIYE